MRKSPFIPILFIILILMTIGFKNLREETFALFTWTETTVEDFSDGIFEDVIITNIADGEVQLPHPIVKTVEDYRDDSVHRFVAYDSSGDFVETWIEGGNVFVQNYSSDGSEIGGNLQVNVIEGIAGEIGKSAVATMNSGVFIVVWLNSLPDNTGNEFNIYGQIFKNDTVKVGSSFQINESYNNGAHFPVVFANESDSSFWILYGVGDFYDGSKIYVQRRSVDGEKIGKMFRLNGEDITKYERASSVAVDRDGNFTIVWTGIEENEPVSTFLDIYARHFISNGEAKGPAFKVNDDSGLNAQFQPDVSFDDNSNFLLVWGDTRDNTAEDYPYEYNIYGQFFSFEGGKIGNNFRINAPLYASDTDPDVQFINGEFQISWRSWNKVSRVYETYVNRWEFDPEYSGKLISSIFDTGPSGIDFEQISWNEITPTNTSIRFRIRTAPSIDQMDQAIWYGPSHAFGYYTVALGETINPVHNGERFIQYASFLNTSEVGVTPILNSVSISFLSSDTISPAPPTNLTAEAGHSTIVLSWDANSEPDLSKYRIYRGLKSRDYDPTWTKEVPKSETSYVDTSALSGITYYYAVSAVDSNLNESYLSEEVSETAYGINIYVDASTPEGGDGSISNPFTTISDAVYVALYGDVIIVLPGAYNEVIEMKDGVSIIGSGAESSQIIGKEGKYIIKGSNDATLQGFTIIKRGSDYGNAIYCEGSSPTVTENVIMNYGEVINSGHAIHCYKASPIITKNYISSFYMGVKCVENSSPVIRNNIITAFLTGVFMYDKCDPIIINNTILIDKFVAIDISLWSHPEIRNNIIVGLDTLTTSGIEGEDMSYATISYNDIWNTNLDYSWVTPGVGDISADPLFMNMDKGDYRLQENSPCIDAGDPDSQYNDIDGSRNDMGAFGGPDPIDQASALELVKSVGVTSVSGFPDDEVSAFVIVDNPAGMAKADLTILYDESLLNAIEVNLTQTTQDFTLQSDITEPGEIRVSMERATEISSGNGDILQIIFSVSEDAKPGDASSLILDEIYLYDESLNSLKIKSITDGVVIVIFCHKDGNYVYVDCSYDGFEDGSCEYPFDTIQEGIDNASWGDTVVVSSGDYYEQITMKDGIYLRGAGAFVTTIIGSMAEIAVYFEYVEYGEISGFTIKAPENESNVEPLISCRSSSPKITRNRFKMSPLAGGAIPAIQCFNNSNPIIEANSLVNAGIFMTSSGPIIKNNIISDAILCGIWGIWCSDSSSPIISGNKIIGNQDEAISINESNATIMNNWLICSPIGISGISIGGASKVKIANNIIEDSGNEGIGINITNSSNITVFNNTINTHGKGLTEEGSTAIVMNNIITGNNGYGVHISNSSTMSYNDVWGNANNYYNCSPSDYDISENPLFVDESRSDYHLTPESPCIDAGNPDPQYNDLDGSRNDMGAYGGPDADTTLAIFGGSMLSIPSMEATPGDTIYLKVSGNSISGIADIEFTLSYGSAVLSFLDAKTTMLTKGFSLTKIKIANNIVDLSMSSSIGIQTESGDFVELKFAVSEAAQNDSYVRFEKANIKDEVANERSILKLKDGKITVMALGIEDRGVPMEEIPSSYHLFQNYPNPFNPTTTIEFSMPQNGPVVLTVYDILGREVETILNQQMDVGQHKVQWNASNVPSGIYFIKMESSTFRQARKVMLLR